MRKFLPWISKDIINKIKYKNKCVSWIMSSFSCQELYQTNVIWVNILVYNGFPQMFPPILIVRRVFALSTNIMICFKSHSFSLDLSLSFSLFSFLQSIRSIFTHLHPRNPIFDKIEKRKEWKTTCKKRYVSGVHIKLCDWIHVLNHT